MSVAKLVLWRSHRRLLIRSARHHLALILVNISVSQILSLSIGQPRRFSHPVGRLDLFRATVEIDLTLLLLLQHLTGVPVHLDLLVIHVVDRVDQLIELLVHRRLRLVVLLFLLLVIDTNLIDLVRENVHGLSLNFDVGVHLVQVLDQVSELRPHLLLLALTESSHPSL